MTDRQLEVLWGVAEYGGNERAAEEMGVSIQTVKNHLADARRRTGAVTTLQAYHRIIGGRVMRRRVITTTTYEEGSE